MRGGSAVAVLTLTVMLTGHAAASATATGPALSVDVSAARHAISPDIYGLNGGDPAFNAEIGQSVARWGGNTTSRYNFKNRTYNTGSDWFFENIVTDQERSVEGMVRSNLDRGIKPVVTVPMIGWVAKDSPSTHPFNCGFPATRFPQQDKFDEWDPNCGNGQLNQQNLTGVPADTSIKADAAFAGEMVAHLANRFGTAARGGVPIYQLDNEPVLWAQTHRDVHPEPVSYDELGGKGTATAAAIKAADPSAKVLGPSGWGYCEWVASGVDGCGPGADSAAHGGLNLSQWYLKNMKDFSDAHGGQRFLDYFDQHFYPQISADKDPAANALRLRSTRSLWDPTYVEENWIGPGGVNAPPLQFIRTMKSWIAQYNPGTKTAITEYNWGALDHINGALAQADVLGIFGREGLDLATMWGEPKPTDPGAYAFRMYRDYDGAGSRFGDVSVSATAADQGRLAVYAAQRSADKALTVMVVNKTGGELTSPLSVAGFDSAGAAQRFTYGEANLGAIVRGDDLQVSNGQVNATYPANSITLLVLPAAGCSASLHVNGDWGTGHAATVTVTNDRRAAMTGWRVSWTWPGDQQVTKSWNTTLKQDAAGVVATDAGWNGSIGAGGSTTFGFQATGRAAPPALTCTPG
ncbi:glycoside hydrolase family 44 protein [Crossiella sp. CA-258035]|uniref:glycoside hydrolase family 44 protein n=1 Tax=Crossiella sp. CA-258035 TaxID=2981138 RepID=UPI0024BC95B7|nr:glycoside hydrolase family 44 protein [Crossiella sp. CA-258035]WHT23195.1 glycoside hydrolase family 44 protein [Crossiella sp. CA-258035]